MRVMIEHIVVGATVGSREQEPHRVWKKNLLIDLEGSVHCLVNRKMPKSLDELGTQVFIYPGFTTRTKWKVSASNKLIVLWPLPGVKC